MWDKFMWNESVIQDGEIDRKWNAVMNTQFLSLRAHRQRLFSPISVSIYDFHMECRVLQTHLILDLNIISSSRTWPLDLKHFPANATSEFAFYRTLHPILGIKDSNFCIIYKSIGLCNDIEVRMRVRCACAIIVGICLTGPIVLALPLDTSRADALFHWFMNGE